MPAQSWKSLTVQEKSYSTPSRLLRQRQDGESNAATRAGKRKTENGITAFPSLFLQIHMARESSFYSRVSGATRLGHLLRRLPNGSPCISELSVRSLDFNHMPIRLSADIALLLHRILAQLIAVSIRIYVPSTAPDLRVDGTPKTILRKQRRRKHHGVFHKILAGRQKNSTATIPTASDPCAANGCRTVDRPHRVGTVTARRQR